MKVYDSHAHIFIKGGIPEKYLMGIARTMKLVVKNKFKIDMTIDDVLNQMIEPWYDPDGLKLLAVMDQSGIEKTVIFGSDFGAAIGDPPLVHPFEGNKLYAELARKHPDRFFALCSIDPRRPGAIKHAETCIEEWGMKGFKLHPAAGFYPTDEILWPLYEKCADWNVPLVFHTGGQPAAPVSLDTQRSLFLAEAASRFPDTKFIMAHVAMDMWAEAVMYGKLIPNLYFDLSYHQFSYVTWGAQKFYEWVRFLIDECGASKLLWATDTPLPTALLPTDQYVKVFTERQTDIPFTDEEIELMMWKNTAEVFGI
ncbi:MAG: amidohydrolase family protein [Deltaproteobacteria bacterium]|nr:amidohydrolase family protein [Deltaproteobacteria bacterium]